MNTMKLSTFVFKLEHLEPQFREEHLNIHIVNFNDSLQSPMKLHSMELINGHSMIIVHNHTYRYDSGS